MSIGRRIVPGLYSLPIPGSEYVFKNKRDVFEEAFDF